MVTDEKIARSKYIQQRTGKTFHVATRLLPGRVRDATYVLYAFFRMADEVVDDAGDASAAQQRSELERIRRVAMQEERTDDPVLSAFAELRDRYDISDSDVNDFVDAMVTDIETYRYPNYQALESYMDGSAAAVGRMMTVVMDPDDPATALPHATALGEAYQLTNFLRDVREDVIERDRIYLPQTTLSEHGVTDEQIEAFRMDERFQGVMRAELRRAESLYEEGVAGIKYLPPDCQFGVLLASVLYADHHRLIRELDYDVLSKTPQLSFRRKLSLVAQTRWKWALNKNPEVVFRDVTPGFGNDRFEAGYNRSDPPAVGTD